MKKAEEQKWNEYLGAVAWLKLKGYKGSYREALAERLQLSLAQTDRYRRFDSLIEEIKKLVFDDVVGLSSVEPIATHRVIEQKQIYEIMIEALEENIFLTRDLVRYIVDRYRDGMNTWNEIKISSPNLVSRNDDKKSKSRMKRYISIPFHALKEMNGIEFEHWTAELLEDLGFEHIELTISSYDEGKDITALKDDISYCFQCKKCENGYVGIRALQEIYFAKGDQYDVAVIVTTGDFTENAKKIAPTRRIKLWNGVKLKELYESVEK